MFFGPFHFRPRVLSGPQWVWRKPTDPAPATHGQQPARAPGPAPVPVGRGHPDPVSRLIEDATAAARHEARRSAQEAHDDANTGVYADLRDGGLMPPERNWRGELWDMARALLFCAALSALAVGLALAVEAAR